MWFVGLISILRGSSVEGRSTVLCQEHLHLQTVVATCPQGGSRTRPTPTVSWAPSAPPRICVPAGGFPRPGIACFLHACGFTSRLPVPVLTDEGRGATGQARSSPARRRCTEPVHVLCGALPCPGGAPVAQPAPCERPGRRLCLPALWLLGTCFLQHRKVHPLF